MIQPDWLIPDWPAPAGVKAVFTTRSGGCSDRPWQSMNLGEHVGDVRQHVAANRATLQQSINSRPVFLTQVHGVGVLHIRSDTISGTAADACLTTQRGMACTIMVADCLPVLLTDRNGSAIAAAHAGWRGLAGVDAQGQLGNKGILETVVAAFLASNMRVAHENTAQSAPELIAWLGPCIGPAAFEVGAEVKAAFEAGQPDAARFFKPITEGKYSADLAGLAKARLRALGIAEVYGNDSSAAWCTAGNPSRFFSHRRDAGTVSSGGNGLNTTGRMAACIWLD